MKYITIGEVIEAKKIAIRWNMPDPYPNISVPMDMKWFKLKFNNSTNNSKE